MIINIKSKEYDTSQKPLIMGILNLSIDSPITESVMSADEAVSRAKQLIAEGATIIDVGADSTSSKAPEIDLKKEAELIQLVVSQLNDLDIIVSIDTWKPAIAEIGLKSGASILNDVTGFRDPAMIQVVKDHSAIALAMHMRGDPKKHYEVDQSYYSIQDEVFDYLKQQTAMLNGHGVSDVWVDPGFGFGKSVSDNIALFNSIKNYKQLNLPIVISASRKGFLAEIIGMGNTQQGDELLEATMLFNVLSYLLGADILRVHDVKNMRTSIETLWGLVHFSDESDESDESLDYYAKFRNLFYA